LIRGDVAMSGHDILPQSSAIAACAARIVGAADVPALVRHAAEARALALDLHAAEAGPAWVTGVLSRLNDAITERALALMQARHRLPPARWCWLGLGSEGRLEQTLATDQDNGLIFSASDDGEARDLRERFLPFARDANQALADCGFPLCDGEVMGGNPRWCLSLAEWLENFGTWVRTPEPEALLNAAIFFDFRPLAGDAALAADLRRELATLTRGNEIFLRMMTANALAATPPLGRLRDFVTVPEVRRNHRPEEVRLAHLRRCGAHPGAWPRRRRDRHVGAPARRRPGWDNPACRCRGGGACLPCPAGRAPCRPGRRGGGGHAARQPDRPRKPQ
jgi:signal-transduction protein with cAMP-binding, CBS, and nucleotidyltransferase domain